MNFGTILSELIEKRGMTQKQLAAELRIAPSTLSGYVQNKREPDFRTLKAIAAYFDVSVDVLLDFHRNDTTSFGEDDLLRIYRSLAPHNQELFLEIGKTMLKKTI